MTTAFRPPARAVVLTGFMGTGKTTVAKLLAERWNLEYVDTDALVEEREGVSIAEIFATQGEPYFRDGETHILKELTSRQGLVLSTGGGILLRPANVALLRAMGPIVCLHASAEVILRRTGDSEERPLLNTADPLAEIRRLVAAREVAYQQADYHLTTDELTPNQAAGRAEQLLFADARAVFLLPTSMEVAVALGEQSYAIHIGQELLASAGEIISPQRPGQQAAVITDDDLDKLYGQAVVDSLGAGGWETRLFTVPSGEASKNLQTAGRLCEKLASAGYDRGAVVFALGGGVVGDLAGFVAAIYMRGIDFVQLPTSLLAQVDASVGGKVAVDLPRGKNLVGAFHQPQAVIIDVNVLRTLPDRQLRVGIAEVIKHAAIADGEMFGYLEGNLDRVLSQDCTALKYLIARSCQIKAEIVSADPYEQQWRAVLNFGHTIGHALERAAPQWQLSHGEAIATGMIAESQVAVQKGLAEPAVVERLSLLTEQAGLCPDLSQVDLAQARTAMSSDKKMRQGRMSLPVVSQIGQVMLTDQIQLSDLDRALEQLLA